MATAHPPEEDTIAGLQQGTAAHVEELLVAQLLHPHLECALPGVQLQGFDALHNLRPAQAGFSPVQLSVTVASSAALAGPALQAGVASCIQSELHFASHMDHYDPNAWHTSSMRGGDMLVTAANQSMKACGRARRRCVSTPQK